MENYTVGGEGILLNCSMSGRHNFIFTLIPVVYGCNFVIGMVGNSMVVAVIYRYMKLKTVAIRPYHLRPGLALRPPAVRPHGPDQRPDAHHQLQHHDGSRHLLLTISLMKSILGFLFPFFIIITCYCLIGGALVRARSIQKTTWSRDDEVLRILASAVLVFFLCWVPHQVLHFMDLLAQLKVVTNCVMVDIIDTAMPFTICIAFLNSCVNPILYSFVGQNFRKNLFRLLHCSPSGPEGTHPYISTKMSTYSYRVSEVLHLTNKNKQAMEAMSNVKRGEKEVKCVAVY
uniref:Angiotensin II receptor type 1 n=1 Tax=Oncorhynchus kisutch TaxID=8019 RepID=A0A8C7M8X9_ONCKI